MKINKINLISNAYKRGKKGEISLQLDEAMKVNPFDPEQIKVDALFIHESGNKFSLPGFWYQDFEMNFDETEEMDPFKGMHGGVFDQEDDLKGVLHLEKKDEAHFRFRFTPKLSGKYQIKVSLTVNGNLQDEKSIEINVTDNAYKGILHVDHNNRFFSFENEEQYVPVGQNVCWYTSPQRRVYDYYNWFTKMAKEDCNFARIWMSDWSFGIVWKDTGVEDYTNRLDRAYELDYLFNLAEEKGIYLMLCMMHHGPFSTEVNSQWKDNPYNVENGGYLKEPLEFFSDERAINQFKKRVRYIVARYGYSHHLFSWELFNEVTWVTNKFDNELPDSIINWHKIMLDEVRALDPYNHMVSTSITPRFDKIYELVDFDYVNEHDYGLENFAIDLYKAQKEVYEKYNKPVLYSEIGIDWRGGHGSIEVDGKGYHLKTSLWAGILGLGAGTGMTWWWDSYVNPQNLYHYFKPVAEFMKSASLDNEDLVHHFEQNELYSVMGYVSKKEAYLYFVDNDFRSWLKKDPKEKTVDFTLPFENGSYELTIYNTDTFKTETKQLEVKDNQLIIKGIQFSQDIALMIK